MNDEMHPFQDRFDAAFDFAEEIDAKRSYYAFNSVPEWSDVNQQNAIFRHMLVIRNNKFPSKNPNDYEQITKNGFVNLFYEALGGGRFPPMSGFVVKYAIYENGDANLWYEPLRTEREFQEAIKQAKFLENQQLD